MSDLSASRVQQYLAGLREHHRPLPPLDAAKEQYTRDELAAALAVQPSGITWPTMRSRPGCLLRWRLVTSA
jgi:hypothetical protein